MIRSSGLSAHCLFFYFLLFPNILAQASGDAGGLLPWTGVLHVLKLLDGLALVFRIDETVNRIEVKVAFALVDGEFVIRK